MFPKFITSFFSHRKVQDAMVHAGSATLGHVIGHYLTSKEQTTKNSPNENNDLPTYKK